MGAITGMVSDFMMVCSTSGLTVSGSPTKPRSTATFSPVLGSVWVIASLRATTRLPSLPERPTARPPAALMPVTICLLIEPVSTISTTSTAASSVTRRPSMKVELMFSFLSMAPICGPPPCTTTGSMPVCFISTMSWAKSCAPVPVMALPPYFTTMVFWSYLRM